MEAGGDTAARWSLDALTIEPPAQAQAALGALVGTYGVVAIEAAGDGLQLRQGRRPPLRLQPLATDLYFVDGDPTRRVQFERTPAGEVTALEMRWADGNIARHVRE